MLFRDRQGETLELDIVNYETTSAGEAERNWLVLRGTWRRDGLVTIGSCPCLLTYELRELTAGLKVLCAGIKNAYESDFAAPYFELSGLDLGADKFGLAVSFQFPDTMDGDDTAEITSVLDKPSLRALIDELDRLCARFPDRT